jgi:hypothetical protein
MPRLSTLGNVETDADARGTSEWAVGIRMVSWLSGSWASGSMDRRIRVGALWTRAVRLVALPRAADERRQAAARKR